MFLTAISLKRPVFATVTILALVVLGIVSFFSLNIDNWPNLEFPYVTVQVTYKGAAPEQVETKIVQKVEEAVGAIAGVKHIYSTAREGVATTTVEFTLETPAATAAQDVRDKIGRIRGELPQDADEPVIMRFDPTEAPIVSVVVTGKLSVREMTTLVDDVIKRRLEAVNGVGQVTVQGGLKREIGIGLDRDKIAAFGLTVAEVVDNLKGENQEVPGGRLTSGPREVSLRTAGNLAAAGDFLRAPVGRRDGVQLYVQDIAAVTDGTEEAKSAALLDGRPAVGLDILKQSGTNTVRVADDIKRTVAALRQELPPGVELVTVRDNSREIRDSVDDVLFNLVIGGVLAVVIVFLFLGNWRSTAIAAIAIPASIVATFFVMKVGGFTINNMSLMALSLAVGLLIDDAIVVIENIVRHMEKGKGKYEAALEGTAEIGLAVTATTLTLVAVFVPVGLMTGVVGQFFRQFGITVAFAVLVSLFVAFTLTPMLAASFLDVAHGQKANRMGRMITAWNTRFDRLTGRYAGFLAGALRSRLKVIAVAALLFVGSLALLPFLGSSFITLADDSQFSIWADVDPGTSVSGAAAVAALIDGKVRALPEVKAVYAVATSDRVTTFVKLKDKRDRARSQAEIMAAVRRDLRNVPGIELSLVQSSGVDESKPVEVAVRGPSLEVLGELAEQVRRVMEATPGAVDVTSSHKPGKPDAQVTIRREAAADLGVSTAAVADTLRTLVNGYTVSQFKDGDDRYDVVVRLAADNRRGMDDLTGIYLPGLYKDSKDRTVMVPLNQVTDLVYATGPSEIRRLDRAKEIHLTASLVGTSLGDYNAALFRELAKIELASGYSITAQGDAEMMGETAAGIVLALAVGIIFIFFILAAQFESYVDPLAIMFSLPLALVGAVLGLLAMRSDLSIMSEIGIVMLMGLVTKNAILLIDFAKKRREAGEERGAALVSAAQTRMRPIMMTTAAMIFGMLPLAFGFGPGAEGRAPMAHAIIGGLVTSTLLTLVVVPVAYTLLDDARELVGALATRVRRRAAGVRAK